MTDPRVKRLAQEISGLKRQVNALSTAPQLAASSIEDGAVTAYDRDGQLTMIVGQQHDGTHAPVVVSGPPPPAPSGLTATGGQLSATATWDGSWVGGGVAPMDLARIEVHVTSASVVLPQDGFESATRVGTIESQAGASLTFAATEGEAWLWLVARSQAGKASDPGGPVRVVVTGAVDPSIFEQAKDDLDAARSRLATAEQRLEQARTDLYSAGGRVDVIQSTLTGQIGTVDGTATAARSAAQQAASDAQDAWNKSVETADSLSKIAAIVRIDSSRGVLFKSNAIATVLSVTVFRGELAIEDILSLRAEYGPGAFIEWQWQRMGETSFGTISSADSRLSRGGFALTISPADVDEKTVFRAVVNGGN